MPSSVANILIIVFRSRFAPLRGAVRRQSLTGTYVACLDCGKEFPYDWQEMKVITSSWRAAATTWRHWPRRPLHNEVSTRFKSKPRVPSRLFCFRVDCGPNRNRRPKPPDDTALLVESQLLLLSSRRFSVGRSSSLVPLSSLPFLSGVEVRRRLGLFLSSFLSRIL